VESPVTLDVREAFDHAMPVGAERHAAVAAGTDEVESTIISVYRETVRPLHRFVACRSGGSRELVEDVLQEVYLRAVEAWQGGRPPREPLPWLKTLARNLLVNYYRRRRPSAVDPVVLQEAIDPEHAPDTPDAAAIVHWGLARLSRREARLIEAFHLERRSVREIAMGEGATERAIEGRLYRARRNLRRRLEPLVREKGDAS
jgi:RNA polymerase sigma-70 factor (ECF subfamily)